MSWQKLSKFSKLLPLILFFLTLGAAGIFYTGKSPEPKNDKKIKLCKNCNLVLISLDTLSANHLPCWGYFRNTSPNMCNFAKDNIYFTNTYSQSSFTLDSHMSIMTSLYPSSHNVRHIMKDKLHPDIKTLAQVLQGQGYDTNYIGVTDDPTLPLTLGLERGFKQIIKSDGNLDDLNKVVDIINNNKTENTSSFVFFHTYSVHAPYIFPEGYDNWVFNKGFDDYIPTTAKGYHAFSKGFLKYSIDFLKQRIDQSDTKQSLERNLKLYNGLKNAKNLADAEKFFNDNFSMDLESLYYWWYFASFDTENDNKLKHLRALYDDKIFYTDRKINSFLEKLKSQDLLKNTIVVITADHGEEFFEHKVLGHGDNIYQTQTHVPLIMAIPGIHNFSSSELTQSIDIFPTVLSFLGISYPDYIQGQDLSTYLSGGVFPDQNRYIISEHHNKLLKSIRNGNWRLYTNGDYNESTELYDLDSDPGENNNVLSQHADIAEKLRGKLIDILKNNKVFPQLNEKFPDWIDSKERQNLIQKGYF